MDDAPQLTKQQKESLVAKFTEVVFADLLSRADTIEIYDILIAACKRENARIDEITKPDCLTIQ